MKKAFGFIVSLLLETTILGAVFFGFLLFCGYCEKHPILVVLMLIVIAIIFIPSEIESYKRYYKEK